MDSVAGNERPVDKSPVELRGLAKRERARLEEEDGGQQTTVRRLLDVERFEPPSARDMSSASLR